MPAFRYFARRAAKICGKGGKTKRRPPQKAEACAKNGGGISLSAQHGRQRQNGVMLQRAMISIGRKADTERVADDAAADCQRLRLCNAHSRFLPAAGGQGAAGKADVGTSRHIDHGLLARRGIFYIGGSDTLPPPLERAEEAALIARMDAGDESVRRTLIERNLRLVAYIARRFENTGINIEDLISIGTIGLIKAVNTYRSDKNIKLATYASRCIENEILMHLRKTAPQKSEVSFDEPLNTDWDGNELLLSDILGTDEDLIMKPIEDDVDRQLLMDAVDKLTAREKEIITLRFGLGGREEKTQKEVADLMGISQSYISRLEKRIIVRLKKEILKMS